MSETAPRNWHGHLLALASGAIIPLSMAPFDLWWISIPALAIFIITLHHSGLHQGFLRCWLMYTGLYGTGSSWLYVSIHDYGHAPVWLAVFLMVIFVCGIAALFSLPFLLYLRMPATHPLLKMLLAFPAIWFISEWFRSWIFTGFPWLLLGYAHVDTPLAGWAPVTGVMGIGFIVASISAGIAATFLYRQYRMQLAAGVIALCCAGFGAGYVLQPIAWTVASGAPITTAIIQGNVPQEIKWQAEFRDDIRQDYYDMTAAAAGNDLIIWPEAAIPDLFHRQMDYFKRVHNLASLQQSSLLVGVPYVENDVQDHLVYRNSVIGLGNASGIYHKRGLVPFGEYVPFASLLRGLIRFFDLPMSNFQPGPDTQPLLQLPYTTVATAICYEIAYPVLMAKSAREAGLLLTVSDDSWFGRSIGPIQHFQIARMRAIENRRFLIRGTNTGISGFITPDGKVAAQTGQFVRTTLSGSVQAMTGETPFQRYLNYPVLVTSLLFLLFVAWRSRAA